MKKDPFLPAWFHIWFLLSCLLLFIGGVIDLVTGSEQAGFNLSGAALGVFGMYLLIRAIWKYGGLISWVPRLPMPWMFSSVIAGWLFAEIDELVNFPFNPLVPGISVAKDVLLTTPMYIGAHLMWFWVLHRYRFTIFQALLIGGLSLGIYELAFGIPTPLALLVFPFMVMIHGVHMVVPTLALNEQLERYELKESKVKYMVGLLLPALGTGAGILVASWFAA